MKNAILNLLALLLLASAPSACKKEKTFKDELVGHWQSVKVTAGGSDVSSAYSFDMSLQSSLEFSLDVTSDVPLTGRITQSYSGDWSENEAKQDVTLVYSDGTQKTWDIIAISETQLTAELVENSVRYQVKFEKK